MTGHFITFEGGEGSGKSTQLHLLCRAFERAGIAYVKTREPGGSPGAEQIRMLLVSGQADWDPVAETLLFNAARRDHVRKVVAPALAAGKTVLCDRFVDSTQVYQGVGKGLPAEYIRMLHRLALGDVMPGLTLILDIDPAEGLKRAHARAHAETRFEALGLAFHQKIRAGFLDIARAEPDRCAVIDASGAIDKIHAAIVKAVNHRLGFVLKPAHD